MAQNFFYFYILQIFKPTALRDNTWILKGWEGGSLIFKKMHKKYLRLG